MARIRHVLEIKWASGEKTYKRSYDYGRLADTRERVERNKKVRDTSMSREFV